MPPSDDRKSLDTAQLWTRLHILFGAFFASRLPSFDLALPHAPSMLIVGVLAGIAGIVVGARIPCIIALLFVIVAHSSVAHTSLIAAESRTVHAEMVTLLSDPTDQQWAINARVQLGNDVLDARFVGDGTSVRRALAGDRLVIDGHVTGRQPTAAWDLGHRQVGSVSVRRVSHVIQASGPRQIANFIRRTIAAGSFSIDAEHRPLLTGLIYGDDREQSARLADAFRAAGLGHLLAVSGQNVVFVLAVTWPLLRRIAQPALRWAASLGILGLFGLMTRFEPSVTRALVMVALALGLTALGRARPTMDILTIAVVGILVVDPLQTYVVGLHLSVAATLGLLILTPKISAAFDRWWPPTQGLGGRARSGLLAALSATVGAQLGVAPLLLWHFESVPLASVPANLVAGPLAAALMMWGLTAGVVAGVLGSPIAAVLHLPTRVGLSWLDTVASFAAAHPLGELRTTHVAIIAVGWVVLAAVGSRSRIAWICAMTGILVGLLSPLGFTGLPTNSAHEIGEGITVIRSGGGATAVILDGAPHGERGLEAVRRSGIGQIDLLLAANGSRAVGQFVATLSQRHDIVAIWAPRGHTIRGARSVRDPMTLALDHVRFDLHVDECQNVLIVEVRSNV